MFTQLSAEDLIMAYAPQTWVDGAPGGTPLSASRFNHMETGIEDADVRVTAVEIFKTPLVRAVAANYAATITPNSNITDVLNVAVLTGSPTLANPTGSPRDGQNLRFRFQQDATGGRVVTFGTAYAFGSDVTTALIPTTASAKWEMLFTWHAGDAKWRAVSVVRGF